MAAPQLDHPLACYSPGGCCRLQSTSSEEVKLLYMCMGCTVRAGEHLGMLGSPAPNLREGDVIAVCTVLLYDAALGGWAAGLESGLSI